MKYYVAGKWQERDKIKDIMELLKKNGHEITCDWTLHEFDKNIGVIGTISQLCHYACEDLVGIDNAETCVFIFENDFKYRGTLVEFGMALALDKHIVIIGHQQDSCIFVNMKGIDKYNTFLEYKNIIKRKVVEETDNVAGYSNFNS